MKKSSIFFSITLIFFIAAVGVFVAYLYMVKYDKQKYTQELNERYSIVSRATLYRLISQPINQEFEQELGVYKVKLIKEGKFIKNVLQRGEVLQKISSRIGSSSIYFYDKNNYLLIESLNKKAILLADKAFKPYRQQILYIRFIFGGILLLLMILYLWIIKKIRPIKRIKREIDKFATGDLDINCKMNTDDEIAEVGNAFNHAVGEIKKLNHSRRLFLRNIMHELKTPITKGRISAEMLEDGRQKKRLISVFERLECMLNEFTAIEQVSVDGSHLSKRSYRMIDVIDEAIDLAMANVQNIEATVESDLNIDVDFKLFSIAIKNMIDNGIKYSDDSKIHIFADQNSIDFLSKGNKLPHELSYYTEPFTQGENHNPHSFGLGLYIVDNIVRAHEMKLVYEYKNGYNIFKFNHF
ncbi:MAG: ArsS family sensor histidine kinase [Epsilonproteobacteria bacterium]|nr:ArsS family sensor histidine kinase [Campylobacterota bacterium]